MIAHTLNRGHVLAEEYLNGNITKVVTEASEDVGVAMATLISLPTNFQHRFAEKIIEKADQ